MEKISDSNQKKLTELKEISRDMNEVQFEIKIQNKNSEGQCKIIEI